MNPIRLPRAAVQLVAAAGPTGLVRIEQKPAGPVLTVTAGQRVFQLAVALEAQAGSVQPFTISADDLARAAVAVGAAGPGPAEELPLVVVQISATIAGIAGPSGTPQTVTITAVPFPDCTSRIDTAQGERASGMTKAVGAAEPRHLAELAEAAVAIGCTAVQFTFAPRFGTVLAEAEAEGGSVAVSMTLAGEATADASEPSAVIEADAHDPLVFTMQESTPRRSSRRVKPREFRDEELPF